MSDDTVATLRLELASLQRRYDAQTAELATAHRLIQNLKARVKRETGKAPSDAMLLFDTVQAQKARDRQARADRLSRELFAGAFGYRTPPPTSETPRCRRPLAVENRR